MDTFGHPETLSAAERVAEILRHQHIPVDIYTRQVRGGPVVQCLQAGVGPFAAIIAFVRNPYGDTVMAWVVDGYPWSPRGRDRDHDRARIIEPATITRTNHQADDVEGIAFLLQRAVDAAPVGAG